MTPTTKAAVIEALELAHDLAVEAAAEVHRAYKGYKPHRHAAADADVEQIDAALAALRSEPEPTPEPGERDERCEFELWMNTQPESASGKWWCRQIDDGGYSCHESDVMWRAWQARASPPPAPKEPKP